MEFRINGCKIIVFPSFMIMICMVLLIDKTGIMLFSLLSALIHEMGHIIFIVISKKRINKIVFQTGRILIDSKGVIGYNNEFLIALGGCLFNFLFFILFLLLYIYLKNEIFLVASASNFGLLLFNIIPIKNLDGMDLIRIILSNFFENTKVNLIINIISFIFLFSIFSFALLCVIKHKLNLFVLICVMYLFIVSMIFNKSE